MDIKKIIKIFLFVNFTVFIFGVLNGFFKPFWLDEILSISFAQKIPSLDLKQIFTQDTHSPFFYVILLVGQKILHLINFNQSDHLIFLRLINMIGLIPIYISYKILKKNFLHINLDIVFLSLISSYFFFFFFLDLRMYFLLLSFSFLVNVLNLTNSLEKEHKYLFIFSATLLSMLHVFGLTISMSILLYRFILNFFNKEYKKCKIDIIFSFFLLFIFFTFYGLSLMNFENMKMFGWIKNQLWYYRVFLEWTINTNIIILFSILLLLFYFKSKIFKFENIKVFYASNFMKITFRLAFPAIILMVATLTISFFIAPIITYRNLVVIFPNLVLYSGVLSYFLLNTKRFNKIFFIILILVTFINIKYYYVKMIKSHQNIEWVVKKTFTKNCKNVPVYYNDAGRKNFLNLYAKRVTNIYSEFSRPIKNLSDINHKEFLQNFNRYKNCNIFIFSFHIANLETYIAELNYKDLDFIIKYAPNVEEKNSKSGAIVLIGR